MKNIDTDELERLERENRELKARLDTKKEISDLKKEIKRLEGSIEAISEDFRKTLQVLMRIDGTLGDSIIDLAVSRRETFERLDLLEMRVFPKSYDMELEIRKIIGKGDGQFTHSLDRRREKSKPRPKPKD